MTDQPNSNVQSLPGGLTLNLVTTPATPSILDASRDVYDINNILSFDKSDVAAIATSRYETGVRTEIAAATKREREVSKTLAKSIADLQAAFDAQVLSTPRPTTLETAAKALTDAGFESELKTSGSFSNRTPTAAYGVRSESGSTTSNPENSIRITCTLSTLSGSTFSLYRNDAPSPAIVALIADRNRLTVEAKAAEDAVIEARQRLNNIASVERATRGAMAESALKSTERGRAILERLDSIQPMAVLPETNARYLPNG